MVEVEGLARLSVFDRKHHMTPRGPYRAHRAIPTVLGLVPSVGELGLRHLLL
jgi:hypothetical protein